jgi:hypothetical protein
MRATILAAVLSFGALSLVTLDRASSLPGLSARPSAASAGLVEEARTQRYRNALQVPLSASLLRAVCLLAPVPISLLAALRADLLPALGPG